MTQTNPPKSSPDELPCETCGRIDCRNFLWNTRGKYMKENDQDRACTLTAAQPQPFQCPAGLTCSGDGWDCIEAGRLCEPQLTQENTNVSEDEVALHKPQREAGVRKFNLGDRVTKTKGSKWAGRVVGFYSTELTPVGYAVESGTEAGSVQIYPESALSTPATTSEAPPTAQGVEGWKEKQLPRSIEEAEAQWFGGRCTGWEHDLLEAARKYASLTHPREQQRVEEWKYCPECGSKEFHGPYEGGERVCSKCSQSWFPDVDYTEVVQEHLSNRKARQSSGHVCDENCGGAINSRHCPIASSGRQ